MKSYILSLIRFFFAWAIFSLGNLRAFELFKFWGNNTEKKKTLMAVESFGYV